MADFGFRAFAFWFQASLEGEKIPPLAEAAWALDRVLIDSVAALAVILLVTRRLPYLALPLIGLLGWANWLDAPAALVAPQLGRGAADNSITFLLLLLPCLMLLPLILWRKTRSRDRIMVLLTGFSIFITALLFHLLIIHGAMLTAMRTQEERMLLAAQSLLPGEPEAFQALCRGQGWRCLFGPPKDLVAEQDPMLRSFLGTSLAQPWPGEPSPRIHRFTFGNGTFEGSPAPYAWVWMEGRTPPGTGLLMIDDRSLIPAHGAAAQAWFLLSAIAHSLWVLGGLGVILIHDRAFHRRRRGVAAEIRALAAWIRSRRGRRPGHAPAASPAE